MGTEGNDELLTTGDVARWLKVHPNTVREYVEQGMPHIRLGTARVRPRFRFQRADLLHWLKSHPLTVGSTP